MEEPTQLNLFGKPCPMDNILTSAGRPKYKTMQELHGINRIQKCKDCEHVRQFRYSRTFHKCQLWRVTHSPATDIKINSFACGLFSKRVGDIMRGVF